MAEDILIGLGFIASSIVSLLIISNPISTSALFIALTEKMTHRERLSVARRSIKYSTAILVFFSLTGLLLFQIFGISLGAFRIAGGILLFIAAIGMLNPKPSQKASQEYKDISIIPLSIPFTAGPGTITTVVVLMSEALAISEVHGMAVSLISVTGIYIGIMVVIIASYLMMSKSEFIDDIFKEGGRIVITRLMGLIVMAIAVQFIINGMLEIAPEFIRTVVSRI